MFAYTLNVNIILKLDKYQVESFEINKKNLVNKIDESEKKLISEDNHFMVLRLKVCQARNSWIVVYHVTCAFRKKMEIKFWERVENRIGINSIKIFQNCFHGAVQEKEAEEIFLYDDFFNLTPFKVDTYMFLYISLCRSITFPLLSLTSAFTLNLTLTLSVTPTYTLNHPFLYFFTPTFLFAPKW